ncbi:hypothetical protein D3C81_1583920 [compost metagenome]
MQRGDPTGKVQTQAGAASAVIDTLNVLGLALDHLRGITVTVVVDGQDQLPGFVAGADQHRMTGITDRVVDGVGQYRSDQLTVEETQGAQGIDFKGGGNTATGEHVLMASQLRFDEVVQFVVGRLQGHLVDTQFVQAQQLHQHAIEVREFEFDHTLLRGVAR